MNFGWFFGDITWIWTFNWFLNEILMIFDNSLVVFRWFDLNFVFFYRISNEIFYEFQWFLGDCSMIWPEFRHSIDFKMKYLMNFDEFWMVFRWFDLNLDIKWLDYNNFETKTILHLCRCFFFLEHLDEDSLQQGNSWRVQYWSLRALVLWFLCLLCLLGALQWFTRSPSVRFGWIWEEKRFRFL